MRTSLREGSGMVSRGSVGLLPALKGRQKKRAGWDTIVWLDLRIVVPEGGVSQVDAEKQNIDLIPGTVFKPRSVKRCYFCICDILSCSHLQFKEGKPLENANKAKLQD